MESVPEEWVSRAHYDLETAKAMLDAGRDLYVLFCSQQALEKMLKAVIVKATSEVAPRLHDLVKLSDVARVDPSPSARRLLELLSRFYFTGRYPAEPDRATPLVDRAHAEQVLAQSEEVFQWLSSML